MSAFKSSLLKDPLIGRRLTLAEGLPSLPLGRLVEVDGDAATAFALCAAGKAGGAVVWILPARGADPPYPHGLLPFLDPDRLVLVWAATPQEGLWAAEEALRSGGAGTVILEAQRPAGLTETRRLQLAAERGGALALLLGPGGKTTAATQRWTSESVKSASPDSTLWRWSLTKNKTGTSGPEGGWLLAHDAKTRHLRLVLPAERRSSGAP